MMDGMDEHLEPPADVRVWVTWMPGFGVTLERPAVIEPCCNSFASDTKHIIECHFGGEAMLLPIDSTALVATDADLARGEMVLLALKNEAERAQEGMEQFKELMEKRFTSQWN